TGGGLHRSDLVVIEAPPATGKTCFALNLAFNAALKYGHSVGLLSLEMTQERLVQRLLAMDSSIDLHRLITCKLMDEEWDDLVHAMDRIFEGNIFFDDCSGLTISQIQARAREMMNKSTVDLNIIDYVDLIQTEEAQRRYENNGRDFREVSRA